MAASVTTDRGTDRKAQAFADGFPKRNHVGYKSAVMTPSRS